MVTAVLLGPEPERVQPDGVHQGQARDWGEDNQEGDTVAAQDCLEETTNTGGRTVNRWRIS